VAARGYNAMTDLRQRVSNDQTRAKAAAAASDSLDAFVSYISMYQLLDS